MGVSHRVIDCRQRFEQDVLRACWSDFESGATPNPCVRCNALIRFDEMLSAGRALGAEQLATGHYARLQLDAQGRPLLRRGLDPNKDQTYFLYRVTKAALDLVPDHDADDRILLGANALWESNRFSLLAGFVEPGESLEAAVVREIGEEAGVLVRDPRYLGSQPWPFPASLMLGFEAWTDDVAPTRALVARARETPGVRCSPARTPPPSGPR